MLTKAYAVWPRKVDVLKQAGRQTGRSGHHAAMQGPRSRGDEYGLAGVHVALQAEVEVRVQCVDGHALGGDGVVGACV